MDANYQIEPELQTSARQVDWSLQTRLGRKWNAGLILVPLLIGGFFAYRDVGSLYALLRQGKIVAAQVTGKREAHGKGSTYWLDYNFDAVGKQIQDTDTVPRSLYTSTAEGGTVQVTYLPSNPSIHRAGSVDTARFRNRAGAWGLVVGGITGCFLIGMIVDEYRARRQRRLAVSGVAVAGKIVSLGPPTQRGRSNVYPVNYSFVDLSGNPTTGVWNAPTPYDEYLEPNKDVTVLCDPDKPTRFCLYIELDAVQVQGAELWMIR